jgi:hypothetical protein
MPHLDPAPGPGLVLVQGDLDLVDLRLVEVMRRAVLRRVVLRLVDLRLVDLRLVEVMRPVGRAVLRRVVLLPVDLAVPDLMGRVVLGNRAVLMAMDLVDLVDLAGPVDLAAPADPVGPMSRADLENRVALADPAVLVDPAAPDLTARVGPVDRRRRRTSNTVSTTGVAPRWAAPGTCRTGSARQITVRRRRRGSTDSDGTMGRPPEPRHRSGTDRRPQEAGAVLRLLAAGTVDGMGRLAISATDRPISDRSPTTATTRSRSSTLCSVGGASGCSASGSRCTDLTRDRPLVFDADHEDGRSAVFRGGRETAEKQRRAAGKECVYRISVARCAAWLCTKAGR